MLSAQMMVYYCIRPSDVHFTAHDDHSRIEYPTVQPPSSIVIRMHNSLSNPESCEFNTNLVASLQHHWAICSSLPTSPPFWVLGALSALVIVAQRRHPPTSSSVIPSLTQPPYCPQLFSLSAIHCLISCIPTLSIPIRLPILIPPPTFKGPGKVKVQGRVAAAHWPDGRHRPTQRQHFSVLCASPPPRMLDIIIPPPGLQPEAA
ncbi:hypothetical protein LCI18_004389 [Fusarium solani-melongenae]|uniref:Uncharacterized protein n=1 Tax=Fusarium solani subsp. cucurbitae TaxID=2747967 RepID=A0ACD3YWT7_FUSSC|nr:hypothetical protein LCI18_004389 [Fusarium solani-melongenae]